MIEMASDINIQQLAVNERIKYYEQELSRVRQPNTFREKVLANVYRSLLQSSLKQSESKASFTG